MEDRPTFTSETIPDAGEFRWYGQKLSDLSREELMGVIVQLSDQVNYYQSPERSNMRAIGQAREFLKPHRISLDKQAAIANAGMMICGGIFVLLLASFAIWP